MNVYFHDPQNKEIITQVEYCHNKNCIKVESDCLRTGSYPSHSHDFDELVIILNGTAEHTINQEQYKISTGDVFVLKSGDVHSYNNMQKLHLYNIGYYTSTLKLLDIDISKLSGYHSLFVLEPQCRTKESFKSKLHLSTEQLTQISNLLKRMEDEYILGLAGSKSMINALFTEMIVLLSRIYSDPQSDSSSFFIQIAKTVSYMENHFTDNIRLEELAHMANISISHFCRIFNKVYHTSPLQYITQLRIKKACELIINSHLNLTQIAFECGFESSNYFSRMFKKIMNKTPKEFRQTSTYY